jgi:hypothetical protein
MSPSSTDHLDLTELETSNEVLDLADLGSDFSSAGSSVAGVGMLDDDPVREAGDIPENVARIRHPMQNGQEESAVDADSPSVKVPPVESFSHDSEILEFGEVAGEDLPSRRRYIVLDAHDMQVRPASGSFESEVSLSGAEVDQDALPGEMGLDGAPPADVVSFVLIVLFDRHRQSLAELDAVDNDLRRRL